MCVFLDDGRDGKKYKKKKKKKKVAPFYTRTVAGLLVY